MRVTTISTAALCSLGVLAAYGVSNKVAGTPQPESPKEEPVVKPSVAPKAEVKVVIPQTVAPPETIASPSLAITRDLAKERRQREAKLAQDLAKVSVPHISQPSARPIQLSEINIPNASNLPIDRIVAQSVGATNSSIKAATNPIVAAQPQSQPQVHPTSVRSAASNPSPSPTTQVAANVALNASSASESTQTADRSTAVALPNSVPATTSNQIGHQSNIGESNTGESDNLAATNTAATNTAAITAPIAKIEIPASQTAPTATLQSSAQAQNQPSQQSNVALSSVAAAANRSNIQQVVQTIVQAVNQTTPQTIQQTSPHIAPQINSQTISQTPFQIKSETTDQTTDQSTIARSSNISTRQQATQIVAQAQQPMTQFTSPGFGVISAASVDETYTLGPGDRISLRFFNTPEYNGDVQVQVDGTLNLPVVGSFSVAGMTLKQAEAEIAARYQSELRYAVVTVSLVQPRPLQVAIAGEVQQPGSYTLSLVEGAQFPSVVRAIQAAGGTTQAADLRNVQVQRASRTNPGQTIAVNLVDLLQNGNLSQDLKLRDGDRIVIPTATTVDFAEASQFSASNFAANPSQAFDVAIVGEVFRPGAYKMGGEGGRATVTQAIQLAGGVKPAANLRQIQIRRATRSGAEQVINIDFWQLLQSGNLTQDLVLQQGDRITIPTATASTAAETTLLTAANISPESISVNVVGEVKSPGAVSVAPSSTLNQAILAAGGLNNRATREIELIRLEPNGTLSRRTIKVDIQQGFNTAENPLLLNNDIIVVGRSGLAQFSDQFNQINSVLGPLLQLIPFRPF